MLLSTVLFALISKAIAADVQVQIDGQTFESFGMTGYGFIPSTAVDKYGETISFGSSVANQDVTVDSNGVYHFTAFGLPDRGYNVVGTVNTISRVHKFSVEYTPMDESSTPNIIWTYEDTILLKDMNGNVFSGLDCNTTMSWNDMSIPAITYRGDGWGNNLDSPETTTAICFDAEGLSLIGGDISNGFWLSDEYGPSLMKFDSEGNFLDYIQAPDAILAHTGDDINFSSNNTPDWDPSYVPLIDDSGRTSNKGYEGVDISPDGKYLYALLQSATIQDGGDKSKSRMNSRLVKYDISVTPHELVGEFVVVLPTYESMDGGKSKTNTASQSEMRVLAEDIIMFLPRDSDLGHGGEDGTEALFKHVDIWCLKDADNILGMYDGLGDQISSSKGKLNSDITPATYYSFIDLIDPTELAKFGLHNGGASDSTLINEKWEGMTLIPIECTEDEYYLLLVSDNDYKTTQGFEDFGNITFDAGIDVDNQSMIFHIKLPALPHGATCSSSSSVSSSVASSSSLISSSVASSVSSSVSSAASSYNVESTSSSSVSVSTLESSSSSSTASVSTSESSLSSSSSSSSSSSNAKENMITIAPVATPVYIWSGDVISTETITFYDGEASIPVEGLFGREITEQTVVLIPTPTVTGWTGSFTTTTVVKMTELLNDGQLTIVDVTLVETPISSVVEITSSTTNDDTSGTTSNTKETGTESGSNDNLNNQSMTTIVTVIDGVTDTIVVPCETSSSEASMTTITTVEEGVTKTLVVPCETSSSEASMTTITTVEEGITKSVDLCDSISCDNIPTTLSSTVVAPSISESIEPSSTPSLSTYIDAAPINQIGSAAGILALAAFLL